MPFRLWLLRTAHNRLIELERFHLQAAKRSADREIPLPDNSSTTLARLLLTGRPTPVEEAALREEARVVRSCLAQLKEPDREVLMLRMFDDLSNTEVALMLDQNPETTKKRFARALLKMKQLLRDAGMEGSQS
jgi:RNA polymerase sigma-70 factor (ECF subfamily)